MNTCVFHYRPSQTPSFNITTSCLFHPTDPSWWRYKEGCMGYHDTLANNQLRTHLKTHGYSQVAHTHGLLRHATRDILFILVVDNFRIKYTKKATSTISSQPSNSNTPQLSTYLASSSVIFPSGGTIGNSMSIYPCPDISI